MVVELKAIEYLAFGGGFVFGCQTLSSQQLHSFYHLLCIVRIWYQATLLFPSSTERIYKSRCFCGGAHLLDALMPVCLRHKDPQDDRSITIDSLSLSLLLSFSSLSNSIIKNLSAWFLHQYFINRFYITIPSKQPCKHRPVTKAEILSRKLCRRSVVADQIVTGLKIN